VRLAEISDPEDQRSRFRRLVLESTGGSTKVCCLKYKVQFDTSTVRSWVLPLLMRIDVGDYPTKAGRIIGLSRQHTWYYIHKLEECNLIRREKRSNVVFYELTDESKNLLR